MNKEELVCTSPFSIVTLPLVRLRFSTPFEFEEYLLTSTLGARASFTRNKNGCHVTITHSTTAAAITVPTSKIHPPFSFCQNVAIGPIIAKLSAK
jgi:hypothetical protein